MTRTLGWSLAVLTLSVALVGGQSNYANRGNSIEYPNEGLPDSTLLDGKVTKLDDISPVIFLNRTKAKLNCASGYMQVELQFDEPFYGIAYADFDRTSACQVTGTGNFSARIELPLKGCGTHQDPLRVFTNNIIVRFHPFLEIDGDEVITIVCRYPPPIAPPPAGIVGPIRLDEPPPLPLPAPLKGFQILLIICGILFLSLVLLGLGCSYYALRRKKVQVVRRHPFSTGTGSEITKLSGSSLGNISMFDVLKIPRAHAQTAGSTTGSSEINISSEAALISDTIPSDYPSESPSSEAEDIDTRRSLSSGGSFENRAYVHDSYYTEEIGQTTETEIRHVVPKRPLPEPKFDVQVRVKKAAPPPPSPTPPPSESEMSMKMSERNLTAILEEARPVKTTFTYVPEIHQPPGPAKLSTPPPVYSTIVRKHPPESKQVAKTEERYTREDVVDYRRPSMEAMQSRSMTEMIERPAKMSPPPPVVPPTYVSEMSTQDRIMTVSEMIEPPVVVSRRPELKTHVVDDVFLRTITEKKTVEDVERHRRQITEFRKPVPPPKWDVTIRNYPDPDGVARDDSTTDWDSYSETSSVSTYPVQPTYRVQRQNITEKSEVEIENIYKSTIQTPVEARPKQNWEVMLRVLEPAYESGDDRSDVESLASVLTLEDRQKWREIITQESTLRQELTEAIVREDYEKIKKDERFGKVFEPEKWDVIIRVLAPPKRQYDQQQRGSGGSKYRRKAEWDTRSRRSSLPTLYEYDSDGGSSVRTLTTDGGRGPPGVDHAARSRRSSMRSEMDVRSMSEMTIDMRAQMSDGLSDMSSYYQPVNRYYDDEYVARASEDDERSLVRSISQPSLARSGSEFTEHWAVRSRHWESPETSPRSSRSRRFHQVRQSRYEHNSQHNWFGDGESEASYK
uniref:Uncharacterized protein n=2 Tax=Lygus hesperus TaxID=30085 RepID=A0A146MEY4_LYGHE